jgi:hypothetical protein
MSNTVFSSFEPTFENMTSEISRFEALHAERRELESEIEVEILKIDRAAMGELKAAQEELQVTNLRFASLVARLEGTTGGT